MENNDLNRAYLMDITFGGESKYAVVNFGVSFSLMFGAFSYTLPGQTCSP